MNAPQSPPKRFAHCVERGGRLLSTQGLYNADTVARICKAMPTIPPSEFDEDNPKTVVFNFLVKVIQLADQVSTVSGSIYLARMGEGEYPLADISRVSTHLVNLCLHPALEPLSPQGQEMLFAFAQANDTDAGAVRALVFALLWLRENGIQRYQSFNAGEVHYIVREHVWNFKALVEEHQGAHGMFVGVCAQQASLLLVMLQAMGEAGQVEEPGDCDFHAPTGAKPHELQASINLVSRLYFGAKGCYLDWPAGTDAGDTYELEDAVESDQNGVLWRWDGAALLPLVTDQATASDGLTTQWQDVADKLRAEGYPIAMAYHPLV